MLHVKLKHYLSSSTFWLLFLYAFQSIISGLAYYMALFLKNADGFNVIDVGTIISGACIGNMIGSYLGGFVADKHNPSNGLRIGLLIQGLSLLLLIFVKNFYLVWILMFLMGIGSYLYVVSSNYILNSRYDNNDQRARIISNQHIISNVGIGFASILIGYATSGFYFYIFLILSLALIITALSLRQFNTTYFHRNDLGKDTSNIDPNNIIPKLFIFGLIAIVLMGLLFSSHRVVFPIYLNIRYDEIDTGYIVAINSLLIILLQSYVIEKCKPIPEVYCLILGLALIGFSFLILSIKLNLLVVLIATVFLTIGEMLGTTYAQSLVFANVSQVQKGRALGLYKITYSSSKIFGASAAGYAMHYYSFTTIWIGTGILGLIVPLVLIVNYRKPTHNVLAIAP